LREQLSAPGGHDAIMAFEVLFVLPKYIRKSKQNWNY